MTSETDLQALSRAAVSRKGKPHVWHGATAGGKTDPLYNAWHGMRSRCHNQSCKHYQWYGARGIYVCSGWKDSFEMFRVWARFNGHAPGLTLDRRDVNGPYSPENCRWVTWAEQANNKTDTHYLEFNGEKRSIANWSRITGLAYQTIWTRIKYGWTAEKALTKPPAKSRWSK